MNAIKQPLRFLIPALAFAFSTYASADIDSQAAITNGEATVIVTLNPQPNATATLPVPSAPLTVSQIDELQSEFIDNVGKTGCFFDAHKLSDAPSVLLKIDNQALRAVKKMPHVDDIIDIPNGVYEQMMLAQ